MLFFFSSMLVQLIKAVITHWFDLRQKGQFSFVLTLLPCLYATDSMSYIVVS